MVNEQRVPPYVPLVRPPWLMSKGSPLMSHLFVHHVILAKGLAPLMYIFCTYSKLYTIFQRVTFYLNNFFSFSLSVLFSAEHEADI